MTRSRTVLLAAAALATAALGVAAARADSDEAPKSPEAKAAATRQGLMHLYVWDAGPLFAMAKGDMAYDAKAAETHAKNLATLAQYDMTRLFVKGSSTDDLGDRSRALPAIWKEQKKFHGDWQTMQQHAEKVASVAGQGLDQLRPAVIELGKACGGCHEDFRKKEDKD